MPKKIVITGATGLIGENLCKALIARGDEVYIYTRNINKAKKIIPNANEYIEWDYKNPSGWKEILNKKDAVIHLAGANLFAKRWSESYKKIILNSRVKSTRNLINAISAVQEKPKVFICASAVGYYGDSGEKLLTENMESGNDFLALVVEAWENEAAQIERLEIRRVSVRTGVVLNPEEGALKEMLLPFKLFAGGPLGSGKQWFPWIHIDDIINIYLYSLDNDDLSGAVNAASPNPVKMKEFAKTLGKVLHRPSFFKVPEFALRLAVGESEESITSSLKIVPQKLLDQGFQFKFDHLKDALINLLK
jgi:uncharacterized protein